MAEIDSPAPRRRVHPLDLLALAVAAAAGAILYAFLFRRVEVPRPVDPLLGVVLEVDVKADYPWKREFPRKGAKVLLDDLLTADVEAAAFPSPEKPDARRLRLKVRERSGQDPVAVLSFRWGIQRGSTVSISSAADDGRPGSVLAGEVVSVELPAPR